MTSHTSTHKEPTRQRAVRRLQRDYLQWTEDAKHFVNVGVCPLEEDITKWHFNVVVGDIALHGEIRFPETYPFDPPRVSFFRDVPHRQIDFDASHGKGHLCLDMLKHKSNGYYQGWSSAYSVVSVIAQMETLLHRLGKNQLPPEWRTFSCYICGHDGSHPQEFYPEPPSKPSRTVEQECVANNTDSGSAPKCFWDVLNGDVEGVIFSYLSQSDLHFVMFVNVHLQQALYESRVYYNRLVTCFHSHENFGAFLDVMRARQARHGGADDAEEHLFGIGFRAEYWENVNKKSRRSTRVLKNLHIVPDVLSFRAFCEGVRFSIWREERFEEFLPLFLNNAHGAIALNLAEEVIEKVYGEEGQSLAPSRVAFEPLMALRFLSKVMNTTVVRLMQEVEENGGSSSSIPLFTSIKALQSYMYCYHLLIGFAKKYPVILEHAYNKVNEFAFAAHLRDKKNFPDLGELLIYLTIVPMSWSVFGPVMVQEVFCRNAKWILSEFPWLIQTDKNNDVSCVRLRQSFNQTIVSTRLQMFQFYFLENVCGVGKSNVSFDLDLKLKSMNRCLGQVEEEIAVRLQRRCRLIFQVEDWMQYFELIQLPCPSSRRLSHDLREAILESDRKGYQRFVEIKINGGKYGQTAHEDSDLCLCSGKILSVASRETELKEREEREDQEESEDEIALVQSGGRRCLDVAFCVDCTGSMSSYLASVKVHIAEIARKLDEEENVDVRFAMVGYRDHNGEAGNWAPRVTKVASFGELEAFSSQLEGFSVGGGGYVEAVADGWNDILGLKWRRMSVKAVIQVADIGCHGLKSASDMCPHGHDPIVLAREMLKRDITLYNVGCSMREWDSEQFFRGTAHMTGGLYLTLADATKLPRVILESTKEGLSLKGIIPQVAELMAQYRKKNWSATRDQIGYFVWRELVNREVRTNKVSCVKVDGNDLTKCVVEISEALSMEEVRRILSSNRPKSAIYGYRHSCNRSAIESAHVKIFQDKTAKKDTDGRLITLEQTMRCMNRAEQRGDRLQWMKHGCLYRMKKYSHEAAEKRHADYGVEYNGTLRRIERHSFRRGAVVEYRDYKRKRVFFGRVLSANGSKFEMSIQLDGLRQPKQVSLTSLNISKCGTLLRKNGQDGIIDPAFRKMEKKWKERMVAEAEARAIAEEEKMKKEEAMVVKVEKAVPVPINVWQNNGKAIDKPSFDKEAEEMIVGNECKRTVRPASSRLSSRVIVPAFLERCKMKQNEMVVRSMLAVVLPASLREAVDSVRRVYDKTYCRWMPNIPLLFPFVDKNLFGCHGKRLEKVLKFCGVQRFSLEMFGFGFDDRLPTDRDENPLVDVFLKVRVVCDGHERGWEKLLGCVCEMYPNVADCVKNRNPRLIVGRIPRTDATRFACELEKEWNQRGLLPQQFCVDSLSLLSRTRSGLAGRFVVDTMVPLLR